MSASLHLNLIAAYEEEPAVGPALDEKDILVDPAFLSEPWEEAVAFAAADDGLLIPFPEELTILFHDRGMGVVIFYDALVDQIMSVLVTEKEMN